MKAALRRAPNKENHPLQHFDLARRRTFGQFLTPYAVSKPMVRWATYDYSAQSFLDPGVGTGVFTKDFLENRREFNRTSSVQVHCVDIDSEIIEIAKTSLNDFRVEGLSFFNVDFLQFSSERLYTSIVSNPPYFKHHYVKDKGKTVSMLEQLTGYRLALTTNIYCLFMFRARALMDSPGRCALIVPSEFLNADYGIQVKKHLVNDPAFRGIINFDFKSQVFDDALTTSCIVLFDTGKKDNAVKFISLDSEEGLQSAFQAFDENEGLRSDVEAMTSTFFERDKLDINRKWKNYLNDHARKRPSTSRPLVPLSKYATCSRGIATGANDYFTLSESKRAELQIPLDDLLPCITRSADVSGYVFTKENFSNLVERDARIYLLNPRTPLSGPVEVYIKKGEAQGIGDRYLPAHRDTWFLPESQRRATVWVMVFSRGKTRFIWNKARVNHLTTFHGIYPNLLGNAFLDPLLLYFWSETCQHHMEEQQRQYGNGLKKYEPRDIEKVLVPDFDQCKEEWLRQAEGLVTEVELAQCSGKTGGITDEIELFLQRTWLQ